MRFLLDPTPVEGGGGAPAPTPAQQQPPAMIQVTPDQFKTYLDSQSRLAQIEATQAQREAEAAAEHQKVLIEKGKIQEAWDADKARLEPKLKAESERAQRYRQQLHNTAAAEAVATAFAGAQFASDEARQQALSIARSLVEVHEAEDGTLAVRQPGTGISAAEFLKGQIASPAFAHFLAPSSRGGSGATKGPPPGQGQGQQQLGSNPYEADLARAWLDRNRPSGPMPMLGGRFTPSN